MQKRFALFALALTLLTTACSTAPIRSVPPAAPEVKPIRLGMQQGTERWLDPVIAAFQERHPEYRIEKVAIRDTNQFRSLLTNDAVDVFPSFGSFEWPARNGMLTDLRPFIAKSRFDTAPYGPNVMANLTIDGRVVGLPAFGVPFVFVYNKRLVSEAGVTIPPDRWTWEQFRDTAARLTHGTGDNKVWGFAAGSVIAEDLVLMQGLGLAPAGLFPDFETARKAFSFWHSMVTLDHSMSPAPTLESHEPRTQPCAEGKAAICFESLDFPMWGPNAADFRLAPVPAVEGKQPLLFVTLQSYAIHTRSADPDGAWAFLSFLTGPEGSAIMARQGMFPVFGSEGTRKAWAEATPPPPAGSDSLFTAKWHVAEHYYEMADVGGVFFKQSNGILSGTIPLDTAVAAYEAVLSKPAKR